MTRGRSQTLEVWGEFACFTSPMKVERWSYPFITPSAARGIFDSIYVNRHDFRWQVERIELLKPPRYIALMRNEVKEKGPSEAEVLRWARDVTAIRPILADADQATTGTDQRGRTQRQTIALREVQYRITAYPRLLPSAKESAAAYDHMFDQRVKRGQHFVQPCFGCREFPAFWKRADGNAQPASVDVDAGWMLYDVFDLGLPREGRPDDRPAISLFRAKVVRGVLDVPPFESPFVRKGSPA